MRCMTRNKSSVFYSLYAGTEAVVDGDGFETSESVPVYSEPVLLRCNVSPAKGSVQEEQFGNLDTYERVIVTEQVDCPIDETTVLFVDKQPEYTSDGQPLYDYTVKRVARSKNSLAIAISKVKRS
jgi:hypothetical protein